MTWKLYWTVIGIVYPLYYAVNIAYDLWVNRTKGTTASQELATTYDVSGLFDNTIQPTVVHVEPYDREGVVPSLISQNPYQDVETQNMTVDEFLEEVNKKNAHIVSGIFS